MEFSEVKALSSFCYHNELIDLLPPLAWLFVRPESGEPGLVHGRGVDVFADGFFEGCLGGDAGGDLTQIAEVFGSGMKIRDGKCVFITPSHTLESIFIYRYRRGITLSNSLPFLLEYHGVALPWDPRYGRKFASLCLGIDAYEKELLRTPEGQILRVAYDNLVVGPEGGYELVRKPLPPPFRNYSEHVTYLQETLRKAFADAMREGRAATYRPLATCSSGYDSASVAALAKRVGCREAITLRQGLTENVHRRVEDSGRAVAELLGLAVQEYARPEYAEQSFQEVAEFLATGMGGQDYNFQPFASALEGRVLLTGELGDRVWGTCVEPDGVLAKLSLSGMSLQEFRLRRNFIHIPVPMIVARRSVEVYAISHAPEMEPYRLHNDYDRPIPRRILEESGVPREMFGQSKKFTSTLLYRSNLLRGQAREEYETLAARLGAPRMRYWLHELVWKTRRRLHDGVHMLPEKFLPRVNWMDQLLIGEDFRMFDHSRPGAALEFCVAMAAVRETYRVALQKLQVS